jgi:GGDEF domain-containing protein
LSEVSFSQFYAAFKDIEPYGMFFRGLRLPHEGDVICYLRYMSARHVLVAQAGKGLASFANLGIHLSQDKSFDLEKLRRPETFALLKEFVQNGLEKKNFLGQAVEVSGEPVGLVVLASDHELKEEDFDTSWGQVVEVIASYNAISKHLEKFDHMSPDLEVLSPQGLSSTLQKEVVRARRLKRPVSTVTFRVDDYKKASAAMNGIQKRNWMRAVGRLLKSQSRVNDWIGVLSGTDGVFLAVLPHTSLEGAQVTAERILSLVANSDLKVGGQKLHFTLTCALNEYPGLSEDADALLDKGKELLQTKEEAKNALFVTGTREHFQADFEVEK